MNDDLGAPVSHRALPEGMPVLDPSGKRVGVVDAVVTDEVTGIFAGLVVHTLPLPGRHRFASHEQIAELRERGVLLSVPASALREPPARTRPGRTRPQGVPEPPLERTLRRLWDRLTGAR